MDKVAAALAALDEEIVKLSAAEAQPSGTAMQDALASRGKLAEELAKAEAAWLELGERLEKLAPGNKETERHNA